MSNQVLIAINTFERPDLTGVTLDSVFRNKNQDTRVLVLDDGSQQMDAKWFRQWPELLLHKRAKNLGVGLAARERLRVFLFSDFEYLCALDNDVLTVARFDEELLDLFNAAKSGPTIVSGYISLHHKVISSKVDPHYLVMESIGGLNHFMDRETARFLLNVIPEYKWSRKWDWEVSSALETRMCSGSSFFEHLGIHGSGVNGISKDRAANFLWNAI